MTAILEDALRLKWTKDPGYPALGEKQIRDILGEARDDKDLAKRAGQIVESYQLREELIRKASEFPLEHGLEFECWRDADEILKGASLLCIFGGNRAGKSEYAAKRVVKAALDNPKTFIFCVCQKLDTSGLMMQSRIWHFLPQEIKALNGSTDSKGVFYVRFSEAKGFSDNILVLPNKSKIKFAAYSQDPKDYEGMQFGCPDVSTIGAWAEEDAPLAWMNLLRMRCSNFGGKILWTFTAIDGLTKTMQDVTKGQSVIKSLPAKELDPDIPLLDDCPAGHAPYITKTFHPKIKCIYFFTEFNPYANYGEVLAACQGKPTFYLERRLYGFARAVKGRQFPGFSEIHIVEPKHIPSDKEKEPHSNFMVADPAGGRNWFFLWGRLVPGPVDAWYIYREWPSRGEYGEWHVTSATKKHDGDKGPAQDPLGFGIVEYKAMMKKSEKETIQGRLIDPRAGNEQRIAEQGGTCLIDQLYDVQRGGDGNIIGESYDFCQAQGLQEATGIVTINELLRWDTKKPFDGVMNTPRLFISSECGNLIDALETYTGLDGLKAACKDPIDCLRYLLTYGYEHSDDKEMIYEKGYGY